MATRTVFGRLRFKIGVVDLIVELRKDGLHLRRRCSGSRTRSSSHRRSWVDMQTTSLNYSPTERSTRVSRNNRCPICQKDSWCLVSSRGVLCMRVESNHPVTLSSGETGYVHLLSNPLPIRPEPKPRHDDRPTFGPDLIDQWRSKTSAYKMSYHAGELGLPASALLRLGVCYAEDYKAWAWPMRTWCNRVVGIRLRSASGFKWAVPGSRQGIFIPDSEPQSTCLIAEGPTDTAAAIMLGFYAIGRPSCSACVEDIVKIVESRSIRRVIILSDNDGPGIKGARALSARLDVPNVVLNPPCKDIREFARKGGTAEDIEAMADCLVWNQ